jgi:hypothetical protein
VRDLTTALSVQYPTDAHLVTYVAYGADGEEVRHQPRVRKDQLGAIREHGFELRHHVLVCDVDTHAHHPVTESELEDARTRLGAHPGVGWYSTRCGLRVLQPLTAPVTPERFEAIVSAWLDQLQAVLGDTWLVDRKCKDWTRAFRLPLVRREGKMTQTELHIETMAAIDPPPMPLARPVAPPVTAAVVVRTSDRSKVIERARTYVSKIAVPTCGVDHACHATLFSVAVHLHGFGLGEEDAVALLIEWAGPSSHPRSEWTPVYLLDAVRRARGGTVQAGFHLVDDRPARPQVDPAIFAGGPHLGVEEHVSKLDGGGGDGGDGDGGAGSGDAAPAAPGAGVGAAGGGSSPGGGEITRPVIRLGTDLQRVNNEAIAAIAQHDRAIYQRGERLVRIIRLPAREDDGVQRPEHHPHIVAVAEPTLQERLATIATWETWKARPLPGAWETTVPPLQSVRAVLARGVWRGIRLLGGIVETPVLRPDGTVLDVPGYDAATGLLYQPVGEAVGGIPTKPTLDDAKAAVAELLAVVPDFPFDGDAHKSAWLAGVLTPFAMPAISGPVPMFLIDANTRGSGKTLLCDAISSIVYGRVFAKMAHVHDDAELEKRIMAIALAGDTSIMIDNIRGFLGGPVWELVLTTRSWRGRILGVSESPALPLNVVWYATGNNVEVAGDMTRRIIYVRLRSEHERPELRDDIGQSDLLGWIAANRPRLVRAALTILRAFFVAGRPGAKEIRCGSYEAWAAIVPAALVWAGLPDPCSTREEVETSGTSDGSSLGVFLRAWEDAFGGAAKPLSVVLRLIEEEDRRLSRPGIMGLYESGEHAYQTLRDALMQLCPTRDGRLPTAAVAGRKLGHFVERVVDGRWLDGSLDTHTKIMTWSVTTRHPQVAGGAGASGGKANSSAWRSPETETSAHTLTHGKGLGQPPHAPAPPASEARAEREALVQEIWDAV